MAAEPLFVDTNILVYANRSTSAFHVQAFARLDSLHDSGTPLHISRQIIREYLATITRPHGATPAVAMHDALADVRSFVQLFDLAEDGPGVTGRLMNLLERFPTAGRQVHDANIVATMLANGVGRLLTANTADFARFSPVIDIEPL